MAEYEAPRQRRLARLFEVLPVQLDAITWPPACLHAEREAALRAIVGTPRRDPRGTRPGWQASMRIDSPNRGCARFPP